MLPWTYFPFSRERVQTEVFHNSNLHDLVCNYSSTFPSRELNSQPMPQQTWESNRQYGSSNCVKQTLTILHSKNWKQIHSTYNLLICGFLPIRFNHCILCDTWVFCLHQYSIIDVELSTVLIFLLHSLPIIFLIRICILISVFSTSFIVFYLVSYLCQHWPYCVFMFPFFLFFLLYVLYYLTYLNITVVVINN